MGTQPETADQDVLLKMDTSPLWGDSLVQHHLKLPSFDFSQVDLAQFDPRAVEIAKLNWEDRTRSEYLGVLIFRHLHDLMIDVNAPLDFQQVAIALMSHENHHTLACSWAATALGGEDSIFELGELQMKRSKQPLHTQLVYQIVTVLCCGEVVAYELLKHTVKALPPSPFRAVLKAILKDEVLHAKTGFTMLEAIRNGDFCPWPGDDTIRSMIAGYQKGLLAREVVDPEEAALFEDENLAQDMMALGLPPANAFKACYLEAIPSSFERAFGNIGINLK